MPVLHVCFIFLSNEKEVKYGQSKGIYFLLHLSIYIYIYIYIKRLHFSYAYCFKILSDKTLEYSIGYFYYLSRIFWCDYKYCLSVMNDYFAVLYSALECHRYVEINLGLYKLLN